MIIDNIMNMLPEMILMIIMMLFVPPLLKIVGELLSCILPPLLFPTDSPFPCLVVNTKTGKKFPSIAKPPGECECSPPLEQLPTVAPPPDVPRPTLPRLPTLPGFSLFLEVAEARGRPRRPAAGGGRGQALAARGASLVGVEAGDPPRRGAPPSCRRERRDHRSRRDHRRDHRRDDRREHPLDHRRGHPAGRVPSADANLIEAGGSVSAAGGGGGADGAVTRAASAREVSRLKQLAAPRPPRPRTGPRSGRARARRCGSRRAPGRPSGSALRGGRSAAGAAEARAVRGGRRLPPRRRGGQRRRAARARAARGDRAPRGPRRLGGPALARAPAELRKRDGGARDGGARDGGARDGGARGREARRRPRGPIRRGAHRGAAAARARRRDGHADEAAQHAVQRPGGPWQEAWGRGAALHEGRGAQGGFDARGPAAARRPRGALPTR